MEESGELGPGTQTKTKKTMTKRETKPDRPDRHMTTLEAIQSDIAIRKQALGSEKTTGGETLQHRQWSANRRRCSCLECARRNQDLCDHCFRCGSSDHYPQACRRTGSNQGNQARLPPQDRQGVA